jgi:inner membrane protein YidH
MSDPRVFFAAERTLLAWVRSGLTMMAFGFVVARFGLVIGFLAAANRTDGSIHRFDWIADSLGIALIVLGVAVILGAFFNHRLYVRSLPLEDLPQLALPWLTSLLAAALALLGCLLAMYLIFV